MHTIDLSSRLKARGFSYLKYSHFIKLGKVKKMFENKGNLFLNGLKCARAYPGMILEGPK